MNKTGMFLLAAALACLTTLPLSAQTSGGDMMLTKTVWVAPFKNTSGDAVLDSAALVCRDSLILTLKLLGGYRVPDEQPTDSADMFTIEGSVGYNAEGQIELRATARDLLTGTVFEESSVSRGFMGLFNAVDLLTANLLGKVTRRAIIFGSALLQPAPDNLAYTIYIDGIYLGRSLTDIRVLVGTHTVEIRQDRPFGRETIHSETVVFQEGKRPVVKFAEPALTAAETEWFARLDARVARDPRSNKALNDTIGLLEETLGLLSGLPSESFQTKRAEYQGHLVRLKEMKRKGRLRDKQNSVSFSANFNITPYLGQFTDIYMEEAIDSPYYNPDFKFGSAGGFFELNYRRLERIGKVTTFFEAGVSWGAIGMYMQEAAEYPPYDIIDQYESWGVWGVNVLVGAGIKYPVLSFLYLWASGDIGWSWYFLPSQEASDEFKEVHEKSMNNMGLLVLPKVGFGVQLFNMFEVETAFFYHLHSSNNQLCRGGIMVSVGYLF